MFLSFKITYFIILYDYYIDYWLKILLGQLDTELSGTQITIQSQICCQPPCFFYIKINKLHPAIVNIRLTC